MALKVLICFMALDYATGWLVAAIWHKSAKSKTGALDSKAGYKGLVKKGVMLALVWMAALLDRPPEAILPGMLFVCFSSQTRGFPYWRTRR